MIIEQTRYYVEMSAVDGDLKQARDRLNRVRTALGLPAGVTLRADPVPDDGPALVWQCGYASETELARAESAIAASQDYAAASGALGKLTSRVEIELYLADDESEPA